jgi:membrane protein
MRPSEQMIGQATAAHTRTTEAIRSGWTLVKGTAISFVDDEALTRGAAMAFYAVTALAPVLLIVVAIAGLVFGEDAAQNALTGKFQSMMGQQSAEMLQGVIKSANQKSSGIVATVIGLVTLIITASGVFGEMQSALNAIWDAKPEGTTISRLVRARAVSLALVAALGLLLMMSLAISAGLSALGDMVDAVLPFGQRILATANFIISFGLISVLVAAIYKILPDKRLLWGDVIAGAVATSFLFTVGKSLIGWYLGSSAVSSAYGAAGTLIIVMLWIYYSSQIFLLGAEFTKVYAYRHGSQEGREATGAPRLPELRPANAIWRKDARDPSIAGSPDRQQPTPAKSNRSVVP